MNRYVNPVVRWILRSPVHGLLSSRLLVITVTGRRSGRVYDIPVGYHWRDGSVEIDVGAPDRKQWWRNFRDRTGTRLLIRGKEQVGSAVVGTDENSEVVVTVDLASR
jgi:hypothetical protein